MKKCNMDELTLPYNTIVEALLGVEECTEFGARFIPKSGDPVFFSYKEVVSRAKSAAGTLQAKGLIPGDRVAIILSTSIHFLDAFLGVQLAGGIPSALYPPFRLGRLDEYYESTRRMLIKIGARFLVTDGRIGRLLGPVVEGTECVEGVLNPKDLQSTARWTPVAVDPESPAFLQFSSGATREPKAVIVSHTNLLYNLEMMNTVFSTLSPEEWNKEAVCWLPLYHDMGLVGCVFNSLYIPCTMSYIEPDIFLARPAIWLQTISRFRAGISPAPQFAYNLCTNKIKDEDMAGVDLSDWISAMNGAEPIDTQSMGRFLERFARWGFRESTMMPVYGLAEAALAVTFSDIHRPPVVSEFDRSKLSDEGHAKEGAGRYIASVGSLLPGLELRICDEQDNPRKDGLIGKIMVKGPSITPGYYNDPESTEATIRNGWLDTGDLGFIHDSNLYISGRTKDLIIIRGRNIDPEEIEELLNDMEGIRKGCVAAVSTPIHGQGEQLIMLAERDIRQPRPEEKLAREIKERVIAGVSVAPYHVQILEPGTLPRTSSGKKRRSEALRMFLSGELVPPEKMGVFKLLHKIGKSQVAWGRYFLKQHTSK
jgi:fatty-acyl-CoA synthase